MEVSEMRLHSKFCVSGLKGCPSAPPLGEMARGREMRLICLDNRALYNDVVSRHSDGAIRSNKSKVLPCGMQQSNCESRYAEPSTALVL